VTATLPLDILELGEVRFQVRADHLPRMGIDRAVEHEDGRLDRPEGRRVHARFLEVHHVLPRLVVGAGIAALGPQLGRDGVVGVDRQQQIAQHSEPLVRVWALFRQACEATAQGLGLALLEDRHQPFARGRVEGPAANEDDRARPLGVRRGVSEREHGAPGGAHEGWRRAPSL